jgi:hypothetical protein
LVEQRQKRFRNYWSMNDYGPPTQQQLCGAVFFAFAFVL